MLIKQPRFFLAVTSCLQDALRRFLRKLPLKNGAWLLKDKKVQQMNDTASLCYGLAMLWWPSYSSNLLGMH